MDALIGITMFFLGFTRKYQRFHWKCGWSGKLVVVTQYCSLFFIASLVVLMCSWTYSSRQPLLCALTWFLFAGSVLSLLSWGIGMGVLLCSGVSDFTSRNLTPGQRKEWMETGAYKQVPESEWNSSTALWMQYETALRRGDFREYYWFETTMSFGDFVEKFKEWDKRQFDDLVERAKLKATREWRDFVLHPESNE